MEPDGSLPQSQAIATCPCTETYQSMPPDHGHLFIGAPLLRNLEEGSSTWDFASWMKGIWGWGITLSRGSVEGGGLGEGSCTREPGR